MIFGRAGRFALLRGFACGARFGLGQDFSRVALDEYTLLADFDLDGPGPPRTVRLADLRVLQARHGNFLALDADVRPAQRINKLRLLGVGDAIDNQLEFTTSRKQPYTNHVTSNLSFSE